jgi:hypothetical protein
LNANHPIAAAWGLQFAAEFLDLARAIVVNLGG